MNNNNSLREQFVAIDLQLENFWGEDGIKKSIPLFNEKKCPRYTCHGYLDSDGNCTSCKTRVCVHCHEECKGTLTHTCDINTLENIKVLESDAKLCPGCGVYIHKLEGCYQMWCTICHTTFHYRTGEKLHEQIHNPHYLEWLETNTLVKPVDCNDISMENIVHLLRVRNEHYTSRLIMGIAQTSYHLVGKKNQIRELMQDLMNPIKMHGTRIEYILNEITDTEFKKTCYKQYIQLLKLQDVFKFYDTMILVLHSYLYHYVFETMSTCEIKTSLNKFIIEIQVESNRLVELHTAPIPELQLIGSVLCILNNYGDKKRTFKSSTLFQIDECDVCCTSRVKIIKCQKCSYKTCIKCFERITFNSLKEAECINCKIYFDKYTLVTTFGKMWYDNTYKIHVYNVLFHRESMQFEKSIQFYRLQQERNVLYNKWLATAMKN